MSNIPIANVKQVGTILRMLDRIGNEIGFPVPAEQGLYNFTPDTVTVRVGNNMVQTYDRLGNKKGFPTRIPGM
jgi:hypothetical protein